MRTEALYLDDIIAAADGIARLIRNLDKVAFLADDLYQSVVLQKLIIIGEAAHSLAQRPMSLVLISRYLHTRAMGDEGGSGTREGLEQICTSSTLGLVL